MEVKKADYVYRGQNSILSVLLNWLLLYFCIFETDYLHRQKSEGYSRLHVPLLQGQPQSPFHGNMGCVFRAVPQRRW